MAPRVRQKVDPCVAKEACEAVQSNKITVLQAQKAFGISRKSIIRRLKGVVRWGSCDSSNWREEEGWIVDTLLYAACLVGSEMCIRDSFGHAWVHFLAHTRRHP